MVVLICQRHRLAPLAAAVAGGSLAVGYLVVHFLPERSWASDSFTSGADVSALSWVAASLELVAAVVLAVAGTLVLSRRGGLVSAAEPYPGERSLGEAVRNPLAALFIASQVVTVAVTFSQT